MMDASRQITSMAAIAQWISAQDVIHFVIKASEASFALFISGVPMVIPNIFSAVSVGAFVFCAAYIFSIMIGKITLNARIYYRHWRIARTDFIHGYIHLYMLYNAVSMMADNIE